MIHFTIWYFMVTEHTHTQFLTEIKIDKFLALSLSITKIVET